MNFFVNTQSLSSAKKANAGDNGWHLTVEPRTFTPEGIKQFFTCPFPSPKKNTKFKTPYEIFQLRHHFLLTLQALLPSVTVSEHTVKAATCGSKSILAAIEISYLPRRDILSELLIHHTAD